MKKKCDPPLSRREHEGTMFQELDLILPDMPLDGPMQMALDEILLERVIRPTFRIYRWSAPWVTFGYFQNEEAARRRWPHLPRVRRWSGGGMVLHGEDLTFSLLFPAGEPAARIPAAEFYRRLHALMAEALLPLLGGGVALAGSDEVRSGEACFSSPSRDDLILHGKKVLGGAQRRRGGALLYQGSLQDPSAERIDPRDFARALCGRIGSVSGIPREIVPVSAELAGEKYRTVAWNGRR